MPTIAVMNAKGGVAKTTSVIYTALALHARGETVRVIDTDPQGSATDWAEMAREDETPLPFRVDTLPSVSLKSYIPREGWTLIDTPPGHIKIIDAVARVADLAIVPAKPTMADIRRVWAILDHLKIETRVLLTMVRAGTRAPADALEALADGGAQVMAAMIPLREEIAQAHGAYPRQVRAYLKIADELKEMYP